MKDKTQTLLTIAGKPLTANVRLFATLQECVQSAKGDEPIINKLNASVANSLTSDAFKQLDTIVQSVSKVPVNTHVCEKGPHKGKNVRSESPKEYVTRVLTAQPELIDAVQAEMAKKPVLPSLNRTRVAAPKKPKAPSKSHVKIATELLATGGEKLKSYIQNLAKLGLGTYTSGPNAEENISKLASLVQAFQGLTK